MAFFKKWIIVPVLGLLAFNTCGQTYNGTGGAIPDNGAGVYFPISIPNLGQIDTMFGLKSVCINIQHPYDSDLEIQLVAPDGTQVMLSYANGGDGDNYTSTCFSDYANIPIGQGTPPFSGSFRPQEILGNVNNNQSSLGIWRLYIYDMYPWQDAGTLLNWSISFGEGASGPYEFESSNLPIVIIDTHGQTIPDDPKISVDFSIIDNGPGVRNFVEGVPSFTHNVGIEIRGSSSQSFPKKSYGFETWDDLNNSVDTTILGMPSESDWILNANYTDKTFCRNVLAYQTWTNLGHYGTRYRFCEVVINGEYKGIYVLSEKIKRDNNRVDIAKLNPDENTGDDVTGGYIFKIDKWTGSGGDGWTSDYPPPAHNNGQTIYFLFEYPKSDEITEPQKNYIQNYVNTFEAALAGPNFTDTLLGFRKYAVENTFIDYFLVNEISKNVDGYRLSTFIHKEQDSKGGKIRMGPVWDYDIAWHNANYCDGDLYTGWAYQFPCSDDYWQVPFWWSRLMQDPLFKDHLKCRWLYLRSNVLSNASLDQFVDSIAGLLDESQQRNFTVWPILGVYVWPNPWPYPATFGEEIASLKAWIHQRLTWMDISLPGGCETVGLPGELVNNGSGLQVFPVPCKDELNLRYSLSGKDKVHWELTDQVGRTVQSLQNNAHDAGVYQNLINTSMLAPGVYFLRLTVGETTLQRRVVKL
jgi:subtilisin-like proprotein convertase family protein